MTINCTLRMNRTEAGRRMPDTRDATFVLAELVGVDEHDWIYDVMDATCSVWRVHVSVWSGKLWLLVAEDGTRYWAEQPYPDAAEAIGHEEAA